MLTLYPLYKAIICIFTYLSTQTKAPIKGKRLKDVVYLRLLLRFGQDGFVGLFNYFGGIT